MSRGTVDALASPHPMFERLPAILRGEGFGPATESVEDNGPAKPPPDGFAAAFLSALDTVLAPAMLTLDCLDAYVDPRLTPPDFLPWLAGWVGVRADERWSDDQLRALMGIAVSLYRRRGTARGLRDLVRAYAGVDPEIEDSGGAAVTARRDLGAAGGTPTFPGSDDGWVRVRVTVPPGALVDAARLTELVTSSVPASTRVDVEVATASR